jgi:hypothetical protein
MRRALPFLFALVLLAGCGGGEDNVDKSALIGHLEEGWEAEKVPQPLIDCIARQLETSLTNAQVEEAYDSLPEEGSGEEFIEAIGVGSFEKSGLVCAKQMLRSGDFTRGEVRKAFELLASA